VTASQRRRRSRPPSMFRFGHRYWIHRRAYSNSKISQGTLWPFPCRSATTTPTKSKRGGGAGERLSPGARNGPYYGLMQIHPDTARSMGYRGWPAGLLDAATNLEYGVRYLRGAWLVSGGDRTRAYDWYRRGYYYEAKRLGLLEETGLR